MIILESGDIKIRTLADNDSDLLVKWLTDTVVLKYYEGRDNPHDLNLVRSHFYRIDEITRCIVVFEGDAIGYIQFYPLDASGKEKYGFEDFKGAIFGTDQFIGESGYWNRGIGKLIVSSMVNYLISVMGAEKIVMDPQTWNKRAIACYEKCGFKKIKLLPKNEWHEGELRDCWLMEYSV